MRCKCSSRAYHVRSTADTDAKQWDDSPNPCTLNDVSNHLQKRLRSTPSSSSPAAAAEVMSGTERLLANIRDLLETSVGRMTQQHDKDDENQRMMDDWVVAAAIIDRICFILMAICFLGGTIALAVLCGSRYVRGE